MKSYFFYIVRYTFCGACWLSLFVLPVWFYYKSCVHDDCCKYLIKANNKKTAFIISESGFSFIVRLKLSQIRF